MLGDRSLPNDGRSDGLHPDQLGTLGEFAVDRVNLTGSRGRLFPYLPILDTHGIDRAYAWDGRGPVNFVQVKTTDGPVERTSCEWTLHGGTFKVHDRLWVTLLLVDPLTGEAQRDCFHLPAAAAARLASPQHPGAPRYVLEGSFANPCKLSRYQRRLSDLWESFAPREAARGPYPGPRLGPPADMREATGGIFQLSFVTELLRASELLLGYKPLNDLGGRNLLVQLAGTPKALFVEVKGRIQRHSRNSIEIPVPRRTFTAAPDFWLVFYYLDEKRLTLFEDCWLVPSLEFERRTANQADRNALNFQADLIADRDGWRQFRHPVRAQADVLIAALRELALD